MSTHTCTKEAPYNGQTIAAGDRWQHPDAVLIDEEYNGLSGGGDYEQYECPHCKVTFRVQLPD